MQEDFLHYLWEFQKWKMPSLKTTENIDLTILSVGSHNFSSGPDFFNSRVVIGDQEWAGNVEIHINSSDWYFHSHESDPNYDNVILHVVWNHDSEVFRKDNSALPVLELKHLIFENTIKNYNNLLENPSGKWINCEQDFHVFNDFQVNNWLERLYFERLEEKSEVVFQLLKESSNNWEEVLFKMLAKNFGLNVNGEAFLSMANSIPFSAMRKIGHDRQKLEALFFGQAGILEKDIEESHYQELQEEFSYLKHKFKLDNQGVLPVKYFRLRPDNFPSLRLAQLASLYSKQAGLFSEVINTASIKDLHQLFELKISDFWESHYTFEKSHSKRKKPLTENFKNLLIINTLVPIKFCYARKHGREINEEITGFMLFLKNETNQIIKKFNSLRPKTAQNALQSQALLQLKQHYCDKNQCLKCNLGIKLLEREGQM